MKQMQLNKFCEEYGMNRKTVERLIYGSGFPAYKIGGRWYIDIPAYEKWREIEHRKQYKYAER